jgi:hypothetical protein
MQRKKLRVTTYKKEYERAISRVKSKTGRYMKAKRQSTVEPVFGTLTQFMGLRKVKTLRIKQANKVMMMAAVAYNFQLSSVSLWMIVFLGNCIYLSVDIFM